MSPLYRTMIADPHYSKATTATPVGWDPILVDDLDVSSEASTPTVTPLSGCCSTTSTSVAMPACGSGNSSVRLPSLRPAAAGPDSVTGAPHWEPFTNGNATSALVPVAFGGGAA